MLSRRKDKLFTKVKQCDCDLVMTKNDAQKRLPPWFKIRLKSNERSEFVNRTIRDNKLHTVCHSASCPNQPECWSAGTATFMILGNICTRGCRFCSVPKGVPDSLDREEPYRVADAVSALRLKYAVITSVTRDDLSDGGSAIFAETIQAIRAQAPDCRVEVLIPDFNGSVSSIITVLNAQPDVLSHNIETVPALYAKVRPQADYRRSVDLLTLARNHGAVTKAGIMLGLGENRTEVMLVMKDLRKAGCSILTLGQYLKPSIKHLPVEKYYHPDEFIILEKEALTLGFKHVVSGPLVRSSYKAGVQVNLSTDI